MIMEILPAIDLREGRVVRLRQGDYSLQTTYSDDPASVARTISAAGAGWIHVVDLDGARSGRPANTDAIRAIREGVDVRLELGGGMRDEQTVRSAIDLGADRVIIGSAALADWAWFESLLDRDGLAGRVALALDAREGRLAVNGWTRWLAASPLDIAARTVGRPIAAIIYTDIARDGMLTGVNVEGAAELIAATDVPVIASGGVASMDHVVACREIGCWGAIVGRAWYEGAIDLAEACRMAR